MTGRDWHVTPAVLLPKVHQLTLIRRKHQRNRVIVYKVTALYSYKMDRILAMGMGRREAKERTGKLSLIKCSLPSVTCVTFSVEG